MKAHRRAWGLLLCALFSLGAIAAASSQDEEPAPVTLAYNYKEGEVSRYQTTLTTSIGGMEIVITTVGKETVKEVKPDGRFTLVSETESRKVTVNGMEQDLPIEKPVTSVRDKRGKLVDWKAELPEEENPQIAHLLETILMPLFPEKAVKPGDEWQTEIDNVAVKDKKVIVKTKYAGKETVDGVELWKITQSAEADTDAEGNPLNTEITTWLRPATGSMEKGEGVIKNFPSPQGRFDLNLKVARLAAEEAAK